MNRKPTYPGHPHAKRPDPIEYAWKLVNPRVPFPFSLRWDAAGILRRV
jgi:hypothetical protein